MTKTQEKQYWQLKNRIGYTVITGDKEKRRALELEMKTFLGRIASNG